MSEMSVKIYKMLQDEDCCIRDADCSIEYNSTADAAENISTFVLSEIKKTAIEFAEFRDTYRRYESQDVHIEQIKLGGMFSWVGASDETIYEAFLKGEQKENPLHKGFKNKD